MKYLLFALLCVVGTACATTGVSTSNSSYIVLPEDNFGQNAAPVRFTSASRAVDPIDLLFFNEKTGSIGKYQFSLEDSAYFQLDSFIATYHAGNERAPYILCALINGKNVLPTCQNGVAKFDVQPYLWQGENTIILHGFDTITSAKIVGNEIEVQMPLPDWKCAKELAGVTYQWYKPENERNVNLPFFDTATYIAFSKQAVPPSPHPQWVDVELNSSRPLLFIPHTDSVKFNTLLQDRMNKDMISSRMILTSLAVWYRIEFEMPNNDSARATNWAVEFEKVGAGAAFLNGEQISVFNLDPGTHKMELKNIRYGARNTLIFCILPAQKSTINPESGAILEAVELRQTGANSI